jgi:hypothetical protein
MMTASPKNNARSSCLERLVPGCVVIAKATGRKMKLVSVPYPDRVIVAPAKGDPEYKQWRAWETTASWPSSWVYLPGEQMEFSFGNNQMNQNANDRIFFEGISDSGFSCPCCKGSGNQPLPHLVDPSIKFCGLCRGTGFISEQSDQRSGE